MEESLGGLLAHEETSADLVGVVDLPGTVDGAEGSGEVWNNTSHSDVVGLLGDFLQRESVTDGLLFWKYALAFRVRRKEPMSTHHVTSDTGHHVSVVLLLILANLASDWVGGGCGGNELRSSLELLLGQVGFGLIDSRLGVPSDQGEGGRTQWPGSRQSWTAGSSAQLGAQLLDDWRGGCARSGSRGGLVEGAEESAGGRRAKHGE